MRVIVFFLMNLFFLSALSGQMSYEAMKDVLLVDALEIIEERNDIQFSYNDDKLSDQRVKIDGGKYSLQGILNAVFDQTKLKYEILDSRHILIVSKPTLLKNKLLCGYILDAKDQLPIPYSAIAINGTSRGTSSDDEGYFSISTSAENELITISYLGYKTIEVQVSELSEEPCKNILLETQVVSFEPIVLTEFLSDGISQSSDANTIIIQPNEMNILPGSIERDVMSAIQFLPGISSPNETLDGINIRGGTPDQNLVLYDGIPMYHTSHFFGTISAFNPNIIDRVDVHRNGVGSEYGGRVSGVIDIHSEEKVAKTLSVGAGFNLTHLYFDAKVPLWKNSSFIFSTRRSITDIWNTPTFVSYAEKVFQGTKLEDNNFNDPELAFSDTFKFNDANFKWMWKVGKNEFSASFLGALNDLRYKTELPQFNAFSVDFLKLNNGGAGLSWKRKWNQRFFSKIELTNSEYNNNYNLSYRLIGMEDEEAPISIDTKNKIVDGGFNWTNDWTLKNGQKVKFGYQFTGNNINFTFNARNNEESDTTRENFTNRVHALFGEYTLDLPNLLHLNIGLRQQYSQEIKNNYFEPRIALVTDINDILKLKASTSKHFQFISQLVIFDRNELGLNNQVWIASNNTQIPVIESNQWMGGFVVKKDKWTLDVESYVKEIDGITTLTNNFVDLPNQSFSIGKSRIRGIDILLKRRSGRYRSWLSYTLSRSTYEFFTFGPEAISATNDQRHVLQWVHLYKRGQWEFSAGLQIRSGLPTTLADGVEIRETPNGNMSPFIVYQDVNSSRLDRYSKIDASIVYNFGNKDKLYGYLGFSIQNLSNRTNVLGTQYLLGDLETNGLPELVEIDVIGLKFTPNLSANVRF